MWIVSVVAVDVLRLEAFGTADLLRVVGRRAVGEGAGVRQEGAAVALRGHLGAGADVRLGRLVDDRDAGGDADRDVAADGHVARRPMSILVVSWAWTMTLPSADTIASLPMWASVVSESTDTPAVTPTATSPPPAPAIDSDRARSSASAWTMTESSAVTVAPSPMSARVRIVATPTSAPTPTPTLPPMASEPAAPIRKQVAGGDDVDAAVGSDARVRRRAGPWCRDVGVGGVVDHGHRERPGDAGAAAHRAADREDGDVLGRLGLDRDAAAAGAGDVGEERRARLHVGEHRRPGRR